MKYKILFYMCLSIWISCIVLEKKVDAFSLSSNEDGTVLVYEEKEKIYYKNYLTEEVTYLDEGKLPSISNDGRFIVYTRKSERICQSLFNEQKEYCQDIILFDRLNDYKKNLTENFSGHSYYATISGNGNVIAFESYADNIVNGQKSVCESNYSDEKRSCSNIFTYNRLLNTYQIITNNTTNDSFDPSLSNDGAILTFRSFNKFSYKLKDACYNDYYQKYMTCSTIFYYQNDKIKKISSGNNDAYNPYISDNGLFISFDSYDHEINNYQPYYNSIFLYSIKENKLTLITDKPNKKVNNLGISQDGEILWFSSLASNLAKTNYKEAVFVYDKRDKQMKNLTLEAKNDVNLAILTKDKKYLFYQDGEEIKKASYNRISISLEYDSYFVKNKNYNLLKFIKTNQENYIEIVDYGGFDISKTGSYNITIKVTDKEGNFLNYTYPAYVIEIDENPYFVGKNYFKVKKGSTLVLNDYIQCLDVVDGSLNYYLVDDGGLKLSKEGTYNLILGAKDSSNNVSYYDVKIKIVSDQNLFLSILGFLILGFSLGFFIYQISKKKIEKNE